MNRPSRSLHSFLHCKVHIRDKIERFSKRISAAMLDAAPQPKSVLLLSKGIEKYKNGIV